MSQLENTNHCGGVNCPFEYSCVDGCMNPKVRQGTVAELAVTHLQSELSKAQKRVKELEGLLKDVLYRFEDGQWFPSELYDKIWNSLKEPRS